MQKNTSPFLKFKVAENVNFKSEQQQFESSKRGISLIVVYLQTKSKTLVIRAPSGLFGNCYVLHLHQSWNASFESLKFFKIIYCIYFIYCLFFHVHLMASKIYSCIFDKPLTWLWVISAQETRNLSDKAKNKSLKRELRIHRNKISKDQLQHGSEKEKTSISCSLSAHLFPLRIQKWLRSKAWINLISGWSSSYWLSSSAGSFSLNAGTIWPVCVTAGKKETHKHS